MGLLVLGVVGFFLPDLLIRGEAAARRRSFRHALGAFLDLVSIALAGGAGVEAALHDAAAMGQGWSFTRLRDALADARLSGATPWAALGRLGAELGVSEVSELASNLSLAGTEGARVRESLAAKAVSLRRHEAAEAETRPRRPRSACRCRWRCCCSGSWSSSATRPWPGCSAGSENAMSSRFPAMGGI